MLLNAMTYFSNKIYLKKYNFTSLQINFFYLYNLSNQSVDFWTLSELETTTSDYLSNISLIFTVLLDETKAAVQCKKT